MTKIAVIGATGKVGTLIAEKALSAGFDVTAIVRNASKLTFAPSAVIEKDSFALTAADFAGFDAIVSAVALPADGKVNLYKKFFEHLLSALAGNPARLIVVGGTGSLYNDESRTTKRVEWFPQDAPWVPVPRDMAAASDVLKASDVNFTYFSPAGEFDPNGAETDNYTITGDIYEENAAGQSYISYADYAAAVVAMIADGSHQRAHIGIYQN